MTVYYPKISTLALTAVLASGPLYAGAVIGFNNDTALQQDGVLAQQAAVVTTSIYPKPSISSRWFSQTTPTVKVDYVNVSGKVVTADLVHWNAQPALGTRVMVRYLTSDRTKVYPADYQPDHSQAVQFAGAGGAIDLICLMLLVGKLRRRRREEASDEDECAQAV